MGPFSLAAYSHDILRSAIEKELDDRAVIDKKRDGDSGEMSGGGEWHAISDSRTLPRTGCE